LGDFLEKTSGKALFLCIYARRGPLKLCATPASINVDEFMLLSALLLPGPAFHPADRTDFSRRLFRFPDSEIPAVIFSGGLTHPMFIILAVGS